jgi:very-short-patch-repair endonuclease
MRGPEITFERAKTLRRAMTLPEIILWSHLRGGRLGALRFRRQHPLGPYILDFYCPAAGLCIEIDGASHASLERAAHDERRTAWLEAQGITVLRVLAVDILRDERLDGILHSIEAAAAPSTGSAGPPPP